MCWIYFVVKNFVKTSEHKISSLNESIKKNVHPFSPIMGSIRNNNLDELVNNINIFQPYQEYESIFSRNFYLLKFASSYCNKEIFEYLYNIAIENGFDVNMDSMIFWASTTDKVPEYQRNTFVNYLTTLV